jgi:hypothetical protein
VVVVVATDRLQHDGCLVGLRWLGLWGESWGLWRSAMQKQDEFGSSRLSATPYSIIWLA